MKILGLFDEYPTEYLLLGFQAITVIFAIAAVATGLHAMGNPIGFSKFFGLPVSAPSVDNGGKKLKGNEATSKSHNITISYVTLMGVRQLATGIILLTFAYQRKWNEAAIILSIIGVLVAGFDEIYIAAAGERQLKQFHAIPGLGIAFLALSVLWMDAVP